nr:hypothetical protein [Pacificibacter marinus]
MTPELQEQLGIWIYKRQGTGAWEGYRGPDAGFQPSNSGAGFSPTSRGFTGTGQLRAGDDITIDVKYEAVDASLLQRASGDLQPRDRSRGTSDAWIADTAARLDPALLMPASTADRGAPVVGPDGIIESGNGRVAAIERAYDQHPDRADAYRNSILNMGVEIPDGVDRPILIARRASELSDTARKDFVVAAQDSGVARMTPTEIAQTSARAMTADRLATFQPGAKIVDAENGEFVRSVLSALPRSERNAMFDANGALNAEGLRRLEGAFYARAWSAPDLVSRVVESDDAGELKGLMAAMQKSAPDWATLRAEIEAGQVKEAFDITDSVTDAMRLIARAREEAGQGRAVADMVVEMVGEVDLLEGPVPPLTVRLVKHFYPDGRVASADSITRFLTSFAREARQIGKSGDMLGGSPRDVLASIDKSFADLPEDLGRPRGRISPDQIAPIKEPVVVPEIEGLDVAALRAEFSLDDLSPAFLSDEITLPDGTTASVSDLLDDLEQDRGLIDAVSHCYLGGAI